MLALTAAARHRRGAKQLAGRLPLRVLPCALGLLLALAAITTTLAQAATGDATQFTLGNGMQVLVVPNHRVPIVTLGLWYKSGASEDPEGQTGLAHFLEHLMFKGTDRYPDNTIERYSVANGGIGVNAATSHDYTVYRQNLPKQHLAKLLDMEADRMVNLQLKEEHITPELGAVLNERRG
ncbi:MAG TPA: insulinase family protein, partial [Hyphomicrobiaceae bacterium]|nr:insulinase family protein [Hyphomicrobiaceae bacterium]